VRTVRFVGVLGLETMVRNAGETVYGVMSDHGRWMVWNTILAVVPLALAFTLFRPDRRRTIGWWTGVAVFVAFLPNAPYVLSDVIHFFDDVRASTGNHNLRVAFGIAPVYVGFMTIGFGAYVISLQRVRQYVSEALGPRAATLAVFSLHGLSSIGLFLGRFWRFNSWDIVTAPDSLAYRLDDLTNRWPVIMIALSFVSLILCTTVVELLIDGVRYRLNNRSLRLR
jgi:uncharacterized membrane protein